MNSDQVLACWKAVFPNSKATVVNCLGSNVYRFRLAASADEAPNRILDNDPLYYQVTIDDAGSWKEYGASLLVNPIVPNMVYHSAQFRRKTIKQVDEAKAIKRFQQLRDFVMENAGNLKNPCFDITTK